MKIRLTTPFAELSGAVGGPFGIVVWNQRGVMVGRRNVVPANPSTTNQDTIRGYLATAAGAFQSISLVEKAAWEVFGELMQRSTLGQKYNLSAISAYCMINTYRQMKGDTLTDTAPTTKPAFAVTGVTSITNVGPGTSLDLIFTHNEGTPSGEFVMIKTTGQLPSQVVVPKDSDFRMFAGVADDESIVDLAASPQTVVEANAWAFPAVGSYMGIELTPMSDEYVPGVEFGVVIVVS